MCYNVSLGHSYVEDAAKHIETVSGSIYTYSEQYGAHHPSIQKWSSQILSQKA